MDTMVLDDILSCSSLPSLPSVALRVIELTADHNVRMDDLAATIQNDQALAAKILRTVNSSLYGLRQKCTSIQKALVLLGLGPVKALALGFSLVSAVNGDDSDDFDWANYWRRGLNTAVGAKLAAKYAKGTDADEAFLAGLLQDIGMVAMYRALGSEYAAVIRRTEGDHRALTRYEIQNWENQHADIGARLAQRWRLPEELVLPIRYHERPTAAPVACQGLVRLVGLGNLANECLTAKDPAPAFSRFYSRANEWFRINPSECQQLLRDITEMADELGKTLGLSCPATVEADDIIAQAEQQLAELAATDPAATVVSRNTEALLVQHNWTDPATKALGRPALDDGVNEAFRLLALEDEPFSVVHIMLPMLGKAAGAEDTVALTVMTILRKHYDPCGGVICRMKPELFSIVAPGLDRASAAAITRECLADIENRSRREGAGIASEAMMAVGGVAGADVTTRNDYADGQKVVIAALEAVRLAGKTGVFSLETHHPDSLAA